MKSLTDWIRGLIDHSGLTQEKFADALGVTQPTVSRWLKGSHPELPHMVALEKLANRSGYPPFSKPGFDGTYGEMFHDIGQIRDPVLRKSIVDRFREDVKNILRAQGDPPKKTSGK